ncbi:MAG: amino acid permease [Sphingomicrobium sp.]
MTRLGSGADMGEKYDGKMGIWMTSALVVGTIIGAGIFMLPVSLAPLGRNVLLAWMISGAGVLCIVFALAQLSKLGGDGIQANIEREFGPTVAFLVAWAFWVSNWTAQASVAVGAVSALSFIGPQFGNQTTIVPLAIGSVLVIAAINALGVRASGRFSVVTVAIKLVPLLAVILLFTMRGVSGGAYEPLPPTPINFTNIAAATALTYFALTGFESATAPVGKVRDASRTIPRALLGGTSFVILLYLVAGTSIQLLLPASVVATSPAPFADALASQWGHAAASLAALGIAVAAIGCLNGLMLATGELGYAMALRGDLPKVMAKTRGVNTPVVAQMVASGLTIILLLATSNRATASLFTFIILLSTAAVIVVHLVGALAAWKLNRAPAVRAVIAVGISFIAFAAYGTGLEAALWSLVLLVVGLAVRAAMHWLNSRDPTILAPATAPAAPLE